MTDVVVVGAGVIGLSTAYELAGQGCEVLVLEQAHVGREASWAGAGILPPGNPSHADTPEARLRSASHVLWADFSEQLRDTTGIDNGFRRCGGIEVRPSGSSRQLDDDVASWNDEGVEVSTLSREDLHAVEPAVTTQAVASYRLPELGQVRNPRHLKALRAACIARGVTIHEGEPVVEFQKGDDRVVAVRTPRDTYRAGRFCIASGPWSRELMVRAGCDIPLEPIRGQIVLLSLPTPAFHHVLSVGARYLVPRPDGRILIGSTEEDVGFDKRNTAGAIAELIRFAVSVVPALANATYERSWAGLRPASPDGLPFLGRVPETENLFVAAGHFRAGLQMSPATGTVMSQLILDQPTTIPLDGLECGRYRSRSVDFSI